MKFCFLKKWGNVDFKHILKFIQKELFSTVIVSIEDIRELTRVGGVFSDAGGHLHLNTDLTSDLPKSAIYKRWEMIE